MARTLIFLFVLVGLFSFSSESLLTSAETNYKVAADSADYKKVYKLTYDQLIKPIEKKHNLIKRKRMAMDKSGHRRMTRYSKVRYNFNSQENRWIILDNAGYAYGEVSQVDGSLKSHICSFKVNVATQEVFARCSAIDKWLPAHQFVRKSKKRKPKTL